MTLTILGDLSSKIGNITSKIKNYFEIIKDLYNVFISFLPSPFNYIFNVFLIFIAILIIAKFINMLTEIIT